MTETKSMSTKMQTKVQASPVQNFTPAQLGLLQKKCTFCNTPGLVEDSERDEDKLSLQRSSATQAGTTTVPRFGHDFSRVSVHSTRPGLIQTKLKINKPGDIYEQEADRVADAVMQMPESGVQRQEEPEEEEEMLQAKPLAIEITQFVQRQVEPEDKEEDEEIQPKSLASTAPEFTPEMGHDIQSIKGAGQPLSASERAFFEPRFGNDFSHVRIHTNHQATQMAHALNARAFTIGSDVVFGSRQYSPETSEGLGLIAHELAHVTQRVPGIQRSGYGPCTEILETLINDVERSNWPMWLKITYFIVSPLWIGPAAALQFLCMELWHYIIGPISEAWSQEEELPLTEENFLLRLQEENSSRSSP